MELVRKRKYTTDDFLRLVDMLRSPKGCPWDKIQTHSNIRPNLIEEAYEIIEAIDLNDSDMLKEELGDMLLQIAFHCSIEEESESFSFEDVVDSICRKIIERHPHIFSSTDVYPYELSKRAGYERSPYEARDRDRIRDRGRDTRRETRENMRLRQKKESPAESVKNVSKILPALMRTTKVQGRAAKAGFGLFSVEDSLNETFERLHHLENLILDGRQEDYTKELGDLLFAVTEVSRLVNVDAESALYDSCERFKDEFLYKISLENKNKV